MKSGPLYLNYKIQNGGQDIREPCGAAGGTTMLPFYCVDILHLIHASSTKCALEFNNPQLSSHSGLCRAFPSACSWTSLSHLRLGVPLKPQSWGTARARCISRCPTSTGRSQVTSLAAKTFCRFGSGIFYEGLLIKMLRFVCYAFKALTVISSIILFVQKIY